jgi:drug/metabolite transporter (DMT)-like permease
MMGFDIPVLFGAAVRNCVAAPILLLPLFLNKTFRRMSTRDLGWLVLRAAIGIVGFFGSYYAVFYLPIGTSYFIMFGSSTITSFILGRVLFGEKPSKITYLALILALVGMWLVYSVSLDAHLIKYIWIALIGGVGAAGWNILSKKISDHYSATQLNGLDCLFVALITSVASLAMKEAWVMPSLTTPWLANLLFLVMFLFTGNLVINGFKNIDAQRGSLIMLLEIVFAIIVGQIFFHESLTVIGMLGGGLIIVAAAIPELHGMWSKSQPASK